MENREKKGFSLRCHKWPGNLRKKGVTSKMLTELGGVFLAAIIIIAFYEFGAGMLKLFAKDPTTELAKGNFNALVSYVKELLEDEQPYASLFGKPITVPLGFMIVGFDKNWENKALTNECSAISGLSETGSMIFKPSQCQGKACLVLMREIDFGRLLNWQDRNDPLKEAEYQSEIDQAVVAFETFDEIADFSGAFGDDDRNTRTPGNTGKFKDDPKQFLGGLFLGSRDLELIKTFGSEYLMIQGICERLATDSWSIRNIYIEKYSSPDSSGTSMAHFYIAKETETTTYRHNMLRATIEFDDFIAALRQCEGKSGPTAWSIYYPFFSEQKCSCGADTLNLPDRYSIKFEAGMATLLFESPNGEKTVIDVQATTPGQLFLGDSGGNFANIAKKGIIDLQGINNINLYRKDGKILLASKGTNIFSQQCVSSSTLDQSAKKTADEFAKAYRFYAGSNFEQPSDSTCIMGRYSFDNLPSGYSIYASKQDAAIKLSDKITFERGLSVYDSNEEMILAKELLFHNNLCIIDQSLNAKEPNYVRAFSDSPEPNSVPRYTSFLLQDNKACFDSSGLSNKDGVLLTNPDGSKMELCKPKKIDPKAEKGFKTTIDKYKNCFADPDLGDCNIVQLDMPQEYSLSIRNIDNEDYIVISLIKLHNFGSGDMQEFVLAEEPVQGKLCTGQAPVKIAEALFGPNARFVFYKSLDEGLCVKSPGQ